MNSPARSRAGSRSLVARSLGRPRGATARARRATAQPGTLLRFLGGPPVPEALSGSACHAGGFFERIACDLVSADSPAAGEPAVRSAKHVF